MQLEFFTPQTSYADIVARQEALVSTVQQGGEEYLLAGEHAPIYTLGTSAKITDVHNHAIPAVKTGRGGQVTYHGPGQLVVYPILNLGGRKRDIRAYVCTLQTLLRETLADYGIHSYCTDDIGVWVDAGGKPHKIAAIGVRVRKWVTFHGFALNVNPDLEHFKGITPCGISDKGITSMAALGAQVPLAEVRQKMITRVKSIDL